MSPLEGALLGLVQGLTEFLPISSSGHLILVQAVLGVEVAAETGALFEVIVHAGTLLSIMVVFWRDIVLLVKGSLGIFRNLFAGPRGWIQNPEQHLLLQVFVGSLPVVAAVLAVHSQLEAAMRDPWWGPFISGCCLLGTGVILMATRNRGGNPVELTLKIALIIGVGQALALLPGISRSGTTIAVALLFGISRPEAARFSFLLAIPAITGAVLFKGKDLIESPPESLPMLPYSIAFLVSFFSGLAALLILLKIVKRGRLHWFAPYCAVVGIAAIAWCVFGT